MKKLLILALASAFSVVATAATSEWFSGASNGSQLTGTDATWRDTTDLDVSYDDQNNIVLDLNSGETLELTPTNSAPDTATKTSVTISGAQFTPCAYESIDDSLLDGVQTALTVAYAGGNTNYYAYTGSRWETLSVTPTSSPVDVVIEMYYYTNTTGVTARFLIGGQDAGTIGLVTNKVGTVNSVSLAGNGKVASLSTEVELGYASYDGRKYPSVAAAIAARGNNVGNDITLHEHGGSYGADNVITMPSNDGTTTVLAFPRTTTAGQTGVEEEHPYEINDEDDLVALQKAVETCDAARTNYYAQTADIALTESWQGIGIKNGKDLANPPSGTSAANKSSMIAQYDAGAFCGHYHGNNHTVSGFQMVGVDGNPANNGQGLDYCGFFNSIKDAEIKDLKIQYAGPLFAVDTTDATLESGGTFVGVAKNSTLKNLTSLQKDAQTRVSCSKGFGGIVGYLMAGSTVEDCTNKVNITSLASNKAGGIAMITQAGSGIATVRNCQNNGTTVGNAKQKGGIIGYVGVATAIDGCEDTAGARPTFFSRNGNNAVTVAGVNKAPTNAVPCVNTEGADIAVDGFTYATVSGDVATFVKNDALTAGNTYLLTGDVGSGTVFTLSSKGAWIAFDSSLDECTFGGNVAAGTGLLAHSEKSGKVTKYTAYDNADVAGGAGEKVSDTLEIDSKEDLKTALTAWIASGAVDAAALDADPVAVMTATREDGNKLTLLQSYVLNLDPSDAGSTVKATAADGAVVEEEVVKIKVAVPQPRTGTGYTVTYKVWDCNSESYATGYEFTSADDVKVPAGSGRYRVDAVVEKDNN